jgi:hypothetical protein
MCGDTCCPSCGPAQGNYKCPACGKWSDEGCDDPVACEKICEEQAHGEWRELIIMDIAELYADKQGVWIGNWEPDNKNFWNDLAKLSDEQLQAKYDNLKGKL